MRWTGIIVVQLKRSHAGISKGTVKRSSKIQKIWILSFSVDDSDVPICTGADTIVLQTTVIVKSPPRKNQNLNNKQTLNANDDESIPTVTHHIVRNIFKHQSDVMDLTCGSQVKELLTKLLLHTV